MECRIIITREKAFGGSAKTYTVEDNGIVVGKLGNGQTLSFQTTEGVHTLSFVYSRKPEKTVQVEVTPESPVVNLRATMSTWNAKIEISRAETVPVVTSVQSAPKEKRRHPVLNRNQVYSRFLERKRYHFYV